LKIVVRWDKENTKPHKSQGVIFGSVLTFIQLLYKVVQIHNNVVKIGSGLSIRVVLLVYSWSCCSRLMHEVNDANDNGDD